jgi:hypothetical protein
MRAREPQGSNMLIIFHSILTKITEHYVNIGGEHFLTDHATILQTMLNGWTGEVSPRGQAYVSLVTETLLRQFPREGGLLLMQCGVLKKYNDSCLLVLSGAEKGCEPDRVIVLYLSTFARIFLAAPESVGMYNMNELVSCPVLMG